MHRIITDVRRNYTRSHRVGQLSLRPRTTGIEIRWAPAIVDHGGAVTLSVTRAQAHQLAELLHTLLAQPDQPGRPGR